jgi:hypothetical protein
MEGAESGEEIMTMIGENKSGATRLAMVAAAAVLAMTAASSAEARTSRMPPMDSITQVQGVSAVCTGAGQGDRQRDAWRNYPVKFEFVGGYGQYLGDETLTVMGNHGRELVNVQCQAPWVLMNLTPGHYRAHADVLGAAPKSVSFDVPEKGQKRIIVRFPSKMAGQEHNRHA